MGNTDRCEKYRQKNITVLLLSSAAGIGGGERYLLDLIRHASKGVRHIVVLPHSGPFEEVLLGSNIDYLTVNMANKFSIRTIIKLAGIARQIDVDIISSHGYRANFYGSIVSLLSGRKHLSTAHVSLYDYQDTPAFLRQGYLLSEKLSSVVTKCYICVSAAMQQDFIRLGVPRRKTIVIPNGIDLKRFFPRTEKMALRRQMRLDCSGPIIGTVGRMVSEKGQSYLIKALKFLKPKWPRLKCVFVGDGPLRKYLHKLAVDLGVSDMCHFAGIRYDIESIYQVFDLFVLPSPREPFGLVLLEAMASEVPVVATAAGGPLDFIQPGKNGELVPPNDANSMAETIQQMLSDEWRSNSMAQEGRRLVEKHYSVEGTVRKVEEVYASLM